jgi:hypothetical protein
LARANAGTNGDKERTARKKATYVPLTTEQIESYLEFDLALAEDAREVL